MTKRKRAAAIIMACLSLLIFCGMPFQQAHAAAVVGTAVVAIIVAALAAMGITFATTGGYSTVSGWINDMIDKSGIDFSGIKYGVSSAGSLLLNNTFVKRISALATYIQYELGLIDNDVASVIDLSGYVLANGQYIVIEGDNRTRFNFGTVYVLKNGNAFWMDESAGSADDRRLYMLYRNEIVVTSIDSRWGTTYRFGVGSNGNLSMNILRDDGIMASSQFQITPEEFFGNPDSTRLDAITGTIAIPTDTDIGDQGGVLTLPLPWGVTLPEIITDIPDLVLDDELAGNTDLTLEDESEVAADIDSSATTAENVSANPDDYSVSGISEVFPFCIPFDLYDFLDCLAAEPEAPSVTWRFYVPRVCDETFEIDFSEFEAVAQVLRTMELLLFCVGLAFVTRHLLRG